MRPSQIPPEDLDRRRAEAVEKVRTTALNALAAELRDEFVGERGFRGGRMCPAGLRRFLGGWTDATPRPAEPPSSAPDATAFAQRGGEVVILGALVRDLHPERREAALLKLLGTIASVHRRHGLPLPSWFAEAALTAGSGGAWAQSHDGE